VNWPDPTGHCVINDDGKCDLAATKDCKNSGSSSSTSDAQQAAVASNPQKAYDALAALLPSADVTPAKGTCGWDVPQGCVSAAHAYYLILRAAVAQEAARRGIALSPDAMDQITKVMAAQVV
jgi:hypothetical protein